MVGIKSFFMLAIGIIYSNVAIANKVLEIKDFVKISTSRNVQISPDGKHLSVIFRKDGLDLLAILDRSTQKPLKIISVGGAEKSVGKVYWVNDERLVYTVTKSHVWDKTRYDTGELIGVNVNGSMHKPIFGYRSGQKQIGSMIKKADPEYGNQKILDLLKTDKKNILIVFYPWRAVGGSWVSNPNATPVIYKLNVYSGKKRRVDTLPLPYADAIVDNSGEVRFSIGINKKNRQVVFNREPGSAKWKELSIDGFEGNTLYPISFTEDNNQVYLSANVGDGTRALYLYDITKKTTKKIYHDENIDISKYIKDFSGRRIVAVATDLALPVYHYLDKKNEKAKIHKELMKTFKGSDVEITSSTRDDKSIIVKVSSDKNAGDYYLFETKTFNAEYLLSEHSQIDPELMAKTEKIEFVARDGMTINGYLTMPNGKSKKVPVVVLPHGGPHGIRDHWGYDWEVQLLANHGYAVLQVNFRGSGGFGKSFEFAGHGNWGTTMQDDITDATLFVSKRSNIDSKRICIFGASYGGYAALMGVIREPDLYQCAIGAMGVYDLPMMFEKGDISDRASGLAYLKDVLGENKDSLKKRSPVFNVKKIKADILLIHGKRDRRAPIEQAKALKRAFDDLGKDYEWLKLDDEGHGYYDEANRLAVYTKILDFLDKVIGAKSISKG